MCHTCDCLPRAHPPRAEEARVLVREVHAGLHPRGRLRDVRGVDLAPDRHGDRISRHAPIPPHRGFRAVTDAAGSAVRAGAVRASSTTHAIAGDADDADGAGRPRRSGGCRGAPPAAARARRPPAPGRSRRRAARRRRRRRRPRRSRSRRTDARAAPRPRAVARRRGRSKRPNSERDGHDRRRRDAEPERARRPPLEAQRLGQRHPDRRVRDEAQAGEHDEHGHVPEVDGHRALADGRDRAARHPLARPRRGCPAARAGRARAARRRARRGTPSAGSGSRACRRGTARRRSGRRGTRARRRRCPRARRARGRRRLRRRGGSRAAARAATRAGG